MDLSKFKLSPFFLYQKSAENEQGEEEDTDHGSGGDDAEKTGKPSFSAEQQKYVDELLGNTRKAEREKARKDAEAKAAKEKEEADKKKLEEQGEFKKLAEAAEKKAANEKARADEAVAEAKNLKLQRKFDEAVADLGVEFVNPKASEDAFAHLDLEAVGEDFSGLEDAVKQLVEERSYLFQEEEVKSIDATDKGKVRNSINKETIVKKKKSSGRYSGV